MGRAVRWFRGLLLGKKTADGGAAEAHVKEKKKWGFLKPFWEKERAQQLRDCCSAAVAEERKGSYREMAVMDGDEQNKRAIAVAAATAAVAEAAVAAAHAAAAVVRLTSSGRSVGLKKEERAAVKIQAAFRGYLARRALRALKGLVKLQALVRGNIVRKQAAETLRCMQALVRVQARANACRALRSEPSRSSRSSRSNHGPATPEKYEAGIRTNASKTDSSGSLKKNSSKQVQGMDADSKARDQPANWNWLDQWMEERYWDCREASKVMDDEKSAKILEVDTGKPQFNPKRKSSHSHLQTSCCNMNSDQSARSLATVPDSVSKDLSSTTQTSVPSPSPVSRHQSMSPLLRFPAEDLRESPQFYSATSRPGSSRRGPFTPAKSERACSLFGGYSDYPNYMANTESSRAKVRSLSAPRQRPAYEKSSSARRLSAHGLGGGYQESADSGCRPSTSHASFANKAYPGSGSGRLDRLGCQ